MLCIDKSHKISFPGSSHGDRLLGEFTLVRKICYIWWYFTHEYLSKRWIVDRATLRQARADDLQYVDDPEHLDLLAIFFANGRNLYSGSYPRDNSSDF